VRYIILLCLVLSLNLSAVAADNAAQSPEDAVQTLMLGMLKGDADSIKAIMLPADEAEILWQGGVPPKEIFDQIEKSIRAAKYTRVKEGEKVLLPDGKEIVIEKGMIGDKKVLLWVEMDGQRMPTPFWIEQKDDGWKVDARPLIAARKAAKAAQQGAK
jgi:hypothetical protein